MKVELVPVRDPRVWYTIEHFNRERDAWVELDGAFNTQTKAFREIKALREFRENELYRVIKIVTTRDIVLKS